jgi:hydroxymethylglutaryl-CoA lyase
MNKNIARIFDTTLRDGIQNLKSKTGKPLFSINDKLEIIHNLKKAGIRNIEYGSNVSHKITEMANTSEVARLCMSKSYEANMFLLVPSFKKYLEISNWENNKLITHLSLITASSESFIRKNTNMSFNENLSELDKIIDKSEKRIRLYISTCFGCPIEGKLNCEHIRNINTIFGKYIDNPKIEEIVISDTIGSYDLQLINNYVKVFGSSNKLSFHIHSYPNDINIKKIIYTYLDKLVCIDTSMGNIGGCPNVDKEKLKPNLSTLEIATLINQATNKNIYNLDLIKEMEQRVSYLINQ